MIPAIEFEECYPTDESMDAAQAYMRDQKNEHYHDIDRWMMATLKACAENCCASYMEEPGLDAMNRPTTRVAFSTGGWSGAEDIIRLIEGDFFCTMRMVQWRRGGHYIFEFRSHQE